MDIHVPVVDGHLPDQYTKHCDPKLKYNGAPFVSFPISISNVPSGAKTLAIEFLDYDAVPVSGFTWIHWLAANIPADITEIPENASREHSFSMLQGNNSTAGGMIHETDPLTTRHYYGPTPPNADHNYLLTVYALDDMLPLENGYWLNEFYVAIQDHILERTLVPLLVKK
jgi:Raf kinase inhibitor-like YbhB/YbcL family protein